jgi:KDO2-lipid IV(A) lauroyltransferase
VWYAPDQDYGRKHSVFAPFFGVNAATITATARFASLNNSPVLMFQHTRNDETGQWILKFHPVLADYPTGDEIADATRMNSMLESLIRETPAQYLWLHKRFKTRPEGEPSLY